MSHNLIFGRFPASQRIGESLQGVDMDVLRDYRNRWANDSSLSSLADFPIYGSCLRHIHERMLNWRAVTLSDVRYRPYQDPLGYYAFWFAVFFGVLGIIGIAVKLSESSEGKV